MIESKNIMRSEIHAENTNLSTSDIDRIIEMAWEDRTTFKAIEVQFGLKESDVINLMRKEMKGSSFKMWRKRTSGRSAKHSARRRVNVTRFKCSRQKTISQNKISKRQSHNYRFNN